VKATLVPLNVHATLIGPLGVGTVPLTSDWFKNPNHYDATD
jgi:hypothetical protein